MDGMGQVVHQRAVGMEEAARGSGPRVPECRGVWTALSGIFGWFCVEPGVVVLTDPCGFLPTRDVLLILILRTGAHAGTAQSPESC